MNSKKVAILQSNYIPWKGYFDIINSVDEFIIYDDMQYTKRDWRNRNKIKTAKGLVWLTIPVEVKGKYFQKISETKVSDPNWKDNHWKTIQYAFRHAKYFTLYKSLFEDLYTSIQSAYLSEINYKFIRAINQILNISTPISWSKDYTLAAGKTERLVELVKSAGGTEYLSGPAAKDYIDENLFEEAGITLSWMDYSGYPLYNQLYPPFEHGVSILDLLFNEGPQASKFMKSFKQV